MPSCVDFGVLPIKINLSKDFHFSGSYPKGCVIFSHVSYPKHTNTLLPYSLIYLGTTIMGIIYMETVSVIPP